MQLDEARGIAAKVWLDPNHRRKVMDKGILDSFANILVDEVEKAKLEGVEPTISQARAAFAKAFREDSGFRKSYEANIAEAIFADQSSETPGNLMSRSDCNLLADELIKRIFET